MKKVVLAGLNSYSEVFFLQNRLAGLLIFAVTFINPNVAVSGMIAISAAFLFARLLNMEGEFLKSGFYTYNPLLVGLSLGYLFKLNALTVFFLVSSGVLTFIATIVFYNVFSLYLRLPILSLPFVMVSSAAYLASSKYSNLYVLGVYPHTGGIWETGMPVWAGGFFKSIGAIFFLPQVLPGMLIFLVVLYFSRILIMLALTGYFSGVLTAALLSGSFAQAFDNVNSFNYILIAMAIGGIFLVPSPRSYLLAIIAACASTILLDSAQVFWSYYGIPVFTLPFNLVTLALIYILGLIASPYLANYVRSTPEETLDLHLANKNRYLHSLRTLTLPFAGKWTVWQGFEGKWTHKGSWRYAYDFIITNDKGDSFHGAGNDLADYYAYRKPILSPVRGRVVKVTDNLPDNAPGKLDRENNWGNLAVILDDRGFFVEISHLAEKSVKVQPGEWVERGAYIGACGNSGNSPQPHIHIQVQEKEELGSPTLPFSFVSYIAEGKYQANALPEEGDKVEALHWDKNNGSRAFLLLDSKLKYEIWKAGKKTGELNLTVRMAADGTMYLDSSKGKLYFGEKEGTFYFYSAEGDDPYLRMMLQAMPRRPLAVKEGMRWNDALPVGAVASGVKKAAILLVKSFFPDFAQIKVDLAYSGGREITASINSPGLGIKSKSWVEFDDKFNMNIFRTEACELRRIEDEKEAD